MNENTVANSVSSEELLRAVEKKIEVLSDFGILFNMIPNGYFANVRSLRDIDIRGNELIAKSLMLYDKTHA